LDERRFDHSAGLAHLRNRFRNSGAYAGANGCPDSGTNREPNARTVSSADARAYFPACLRRRGHRRRLP
jgi:hypothetical protein